MKIELNEVRIKNFLSFGAKWQKVPLLKGMNIITGWDEDRGKSNGAGKSSFLEAILFALYGQTHKDIKKEQIINWKNRKNCEVQLDFTKEDVPFTINRGISPDKFEIIENGKLIEKSAHVRDYQKILDEILGMNYPTFMSLIYTNINSSTPILSMKKPEKRKFVEKSFGLELFTIINDKCNVKIKSLNDRIREFEIKSIGNDSVIDKTKENIINFKNRIQNMNSSNTELKEIKAELDEKRNENAGVADNLENTINDIKNYEKNRKYLNYIENRVTIKYSTYKTRLKDITNRINDIEEVEKKYKEKRKKLDDFIKEYGDIEVIDLANKELANTIQTLTDNLENFQKDDKENEIKLAEKRVKLKDIHSKINSLKDKNICPTCGQDVKEIDIMTGLNLRLIKLNNEIGLLLKFKNQYGKSIQATKDMKNDTKNILKSSEEKRNELNEIKLSQFNLESESKEKLEKNLKRYSKVLELLENVIKKTKDNVAEIDRSLSVLDEKKYELESNLEEVIILERKTKSIEDKIKVEKKQKQEYLEIIEEGEKTVKKLNEEISKNKKGIEKLKELIDYLDYMKLLCKDEEVKQYAISTITPYLNKKTNEYLSEVDFSFFVKLNSWLDADVKGPGITKGSYGSLSGGEGRGIDLSLQLGLLDVGRLKAGTWPDCVFYDEILDSSIDSSSLEKLIYILSVKQQKEDNRTFIISHRDNINENIKFDNNYHIVKQSGYSSIKIKEKREK